MLSPLPDIRQPALQPSVRSVSAAGRSADLRCHCATWHGGSSLASGKSFFSVWGKVE